MNETEFYKDVHAAEQEAKESLPKKHVVPWSLGALLLIGMIILMMIPYYGIKLNPEPQGIPTLNELVGDTFQFHNTSVKRNDFLNQVAPSDPLIKQVSSRIAAVSCPSGAKVCQAKAIYYFVRDNIKYVSDPPDEYVETPAEVLSVRGADCDGHAILLGSMLESIGVHSKYIFTRNHVYNNAFLPEASKKYRGKDDYVPLDSTCKNCEFGELPPWQSEKTVRILG